MSVVLLLDAPSASLHHLRSLISSITKSQPLLDYQQETYIGKKPKKIGPDKIAELKGFITRAMKTTDMPGLAISLFDNDGLLLEQGFGLRERNKPEKVSADTLFLIASNTKPLTSLLLSKLVDEGRFTWETPVTQVYPRFRLGDAATTQKVLMKHLVCACTGLPHRDFEWLFKFNNYSPEDQIQALASMQPTTGFGELFQYSNSLVSAAGYIGAHLLLPKQKLGPAYDQVMRDKLFIPLGMNHTTFDFERVLAADHAKPHSLDMSNINVPVAFDIYRSILSVRPAVGAWSNVRDYTRYVKLELSEGLLPDGQRYITQEQLEERRKPKVRFRENSWYALGLVLEERKGIKVIGHGGSMIGMQSNFYFIPSIGLGLVIFTNANTGYLLVEAILKRIMELIFDGKPQAEEDLQVAMRSLRNYRADVQKYWQLPPAPAATERLASEYFSPALGSILVKKLNDQLFFAFESWQSPMGTKLNQDGSISFITVAPGVIGFNFYAEKGDGPILRLTLRDPQHAYSFNATEVP